MAVDLFTGTGALADPPWELRFGSADRHSDEYRALEEVAHMYEGNFGPDVRIGFVVGSVLAGPMAVFARWDDALDNGYWLWADPVADEVHIYRMDDGDFTALRTVSQAIAAGQHWEMSIVGTTLQIYLNGSTSGASVTDGTYTAAGRAGIFVETANDKINSWHAVTLGDPFGASGFVPTVTNPATAADAEWKDVDDVLSTDYVPTCADPDTAASAAWKQVSNLTEDDYVPVADDAVTPVDAGWVNGNERIPPAGGGATPVAEGDTLIFEETFNYADFTTMRNGADWQSNGTGDVAIVSGESEPIGADGKALRLDFPFGTPAGQAGNYDSVYRTSGGELVGRLCVHFTLKTSTLFDGNSATNKLGFIQNNSATGQENNAIYPCLWGAGSAPLYIGMGIQGVDSLNLGQSSPHADAELARGTWGEFFAEIIPNTAATGDGEVRIWRKVSGTWVLVVEETGIQFTTPATRFENAFMVLSFIWGGATGTIAQTASVYWGYMKVTGDAA